MDIFEGDLELTIVECESYKRSKVESLFHRERSLPQLNYHSILDEDDTNRLKMVAASHYIPKKIGGVEAGQDAHFVHYGDEGRVTIGVFDGVGGFSKKGIDSGIYASELKNNAVLSIIRHENGILPPLKNALHNAWLNTKAKGASTACILALGDDNVLYAANVGDSGFMVIREEIGGKATVFKSRAQQSESNCPYQLGRASKTGYSPEEHAEDIRLSVRDGDVVVVGTDGLFDNLFPYEIVSIVSTCRFLNGGVLPPPTLVARVIAKMALQASKDRDSFCPWTVAEVQDGRDRRKYMGGKYDDITVVVGFIGKLQRDRVFYGSYSDSDLAIFNRRAPERFLELENMQDQWFGTQCRLLMFCVAIVCHFVCHFVFHFVYQYCTRS